MAFGTAVFVLLALGLPTDGLFYGMVAGALTASLAFVRLAPRPPVLEVRIVRNGRRRRSSEFSPKLSAAFGRPRKRRR
jgi:hypothetical protein